MKRLLTLAAVVMTAAVNWAQTTFPVTLDIADEASFAKWTVIDANATTSANTWGYSNSEALYPQDKKAAANDWLISPSVHLEAGKYEVSGYVIQRSTFSSDKQSFQFTYGNAPTVEAQTNVFVTEKAYQSKLYKATTGAIIVSAAGDYHFAIHLTSTGYQGDCGFQKFVINKVAPVPAQVSDLAVAVGEKGALQATLTWTNPTKDSDGNDLAKFSGVKLKRGTTDLGTVAGAKGEVMTYVDKGISNPGKYTYTVVAYNEDGDATTGAPTVTSGWVGIDTPKPVSDLAATADGDKVTLTFTAPTESENGGYVDFENVTYRITRDSEVLNEAFTGTTYQNVVPKLGNYTYGVQAQYSTKRAATQTVKIRAGEGFPVPYSETFDQAASFDLFAIHNLSGGARTWRYNSSKKCVEYWGTSSAANHWLITPPIILEEGKTYELKINAGLEKAIKPENYKQLNVYVGKGDTPEAQTTELFGELIKSALMEGKTAYFTALSSGGLNFGFNVTGATDSYSIYIDNITVDEAQVIPAAVSDLKAVPAAKGALAVELSWVNPSKAVSGLDLAKLDKVEVFRGSDLVTIINTPQMGATATYTDNVSEPGKYTYTLVAYADEKNSEDATVTSAWVGPDTPAAPANAALALSDGKPVVTFDAVTAGVNGGYIDTEALGYTITRLPDEAVVAEGVKATTFTDNAVLPLAKYSYSIVAKVGEQVSEAALTNGLVLGDALELPYETTLDNADDAAIWAFYDADGDSKTWSYSTRNTAIESGFSAKAGDAAFTPPFRTVQGAHMLTYDVHGYSYRYGDAYDVVLANNSDYANAATLAQYPDKDIAFAMYETRTVNFTIDAAGIYNIGFKQMSTSPWGISIKNVKIECTVPTGITETIGLGINYYDRAAQCLMLAQPAHVTVVAVNGVVVAAADAEAQLNLSHLGSGVYIASIVTADGKVSHVKFVK